MAGAGSRAPRGRRGHDVTIIRFTVCFVFQFPNCQDPRRGKDMEV